MIYNEAFLVIHVQVLRQAQVNKTIPLPRAVIVQKRKVAGQKSSTKIIGTL